MDVTIAKKFLGALGGPRGFTGQTLAITSAAATATGAISATWVDLVSTVFCFVDIGTAPSANVSTSYAVVPDIPYRVPITNGDKISAVARASAGSLHIHPVKGS